MVGVLEARVRLDHRAMGEIGAQCGLVEKGTPIGPLAAVGAVANEARSVREKLRDRRRRDGRVQAADVAADAVVEADASSLSQLEDAGGSEGFGMRGDAEAMPRRQLRPALEI